MYRYVILPRVLVNVSVVDMSVKLLGNRIDFPIGISPTAMHYLAHHEGEKGTARGKEYPIYKYYPNCLSLSSSAAARLNTCMTLSSWSSTSIEEVAEANGDRSLRWFQLYVYKDKQLTINLIQRAEREGYKALVVTVDTPEVGLRNDYTFTPPLGKLANFRDNSLLSTGGLTLQEYAMKNFDNPTLTWDGIDWLRSITRLPIILKGILRSDDAREALRHNIQGIMVSNHGGRQLDTVPATV